MPFLLRRGWTPLTRSIGKMATSSISDSETKDFLSIIDRAKKITVLTGAGISAESGIPTFRGEGGLWRTWSATELATPEAFAADPSLVWEFYHYRRCVVTKAAPNLGHYAISALERKCKLDKKNFTLLTQNIDGLHLKAGTEEVVELHGSLWKTRCCTCGIVKDNFDMPICPALDGKGAPDPSVRDARIPTSMLPRCKECNGLLRPHVVWFGESLDRGIMGKAHLSLEECDLFIVAGTSAVVQPAAGFAPMVKYGGGTVVEFNIEDTPISRYCRFKFQGPCSKTLPLYLGIPVAELEERCKTKDFPIESL